MNSIAMETRRITILHTNDYHGQLRPFVTTSKMTVGGAPQKAALINSLRQGKEAQTILVDAGDMAEGSLAARASKGKVVIKEMNAEGYGLATPGNHDFDWGIGALEGMAKAARFPLVAANVMKADGSRLPWLKPYVIKEISGMKTAFIGVTTVDSKRYLPREEQGLLKFIPPFKAVKQTIRQAKDEGAQLVVIVSHLGLREDRKMAARFPGVPIVGGHSHTILPAGEKQGKSIIVQAGCRGALVGELTLEVGPDGKVIKAEDHLHVVDTGALAPDRKVARVVAKPLAEEAKAFADVVGYSAFPLRRSFRESSNFSEILADSIRESTGAPYAMVTNFGVAQELPAGPISAGNLGDVVPWDERLYTLEVKGRDLKKTIEASLSEKYRTLLVPSGFSYEYDRRKPEGHRLTFLKMGSAAVEPKKTYILAMNGHDLGTFNRLEKSATGKTAFGLMRDALGSYIENHSPLARETPDGRVKNLEKEKIAS